VTDYTLSKVDTEYASFTKLKNRPICEPEEAVMEWQLMARKPLGAMLYRFSVSGGRPRHEGAFRAVCSIKSSVTFSVMHSESIPYLRLEHLIQGVLVSPGSFHVARVMLRHRLLPNRASDLHPQDSMVTACFERYGRACEKQVLRMCTGFLPVCRLPHGQSRKSRPPHGCALDLACLTSISVHATISSVQTHYSGHL
jgi:hypothetical protein